MMEHIILWMFLAINTITDIKNRTIYTAISFLFGAVGMAFFFCGEKKDMFSLAGGILVGMYVLLFSVITKGAVGFGDGLVVLALGIWMGGEKILFVLMGAFFLVVLTGMIGIAAKKLNRKSELPFVPFLTVSYIVLHMGGIL